MRNIATAAVWLVSLLAIAVAGLIAGQFVFMATSLDPATTLSDGGEAWWDAGVAVAAFVGLAFAASLGLAFWHTRRLKVVALVLLAAEIAAVGWACVHVYVDYF